MRAIAIDRFGGPEVMYLTDVRAPSPAPHEVRIRMAYAGVNPADWKLREGWLRQLSVFKPTFPFVMGYDGSGTVEATGANVQHVKPGDRVTVKSDQSLGRWGTYAEILCVAGDMVGRIPDKMSFVEAATLPVAGLTAWHGLFVHGRLQAGQSVYINAGSGGVGSFAVQFASAIGARVAASCSPRNDEYMRTLGADITVDYRSADIERALVGHFGAKPHLVLDAGATADRALASMVRPGGTYVRIPSLDPADMLPDDTADVRIVSGGIVRVETLAAYAAMADLYEAGRLKMPETEILPIDKAAEALEMNKAGSARGKIVLKLWE